MDDPTRVADALERLLDVIEAWAQPWTARPSDPSASEEPIESEAEAEPEFPRGSAIAASPAASAAAQVGAPPIHFRGLLGSRLRARGVPESGPIAAGVPETMLASARPPAMPTRVSAHREPSIAPSTATVPTAAPLTTAKVALRARDEPLDPAQAPSAARAATSAQRHTDFEREHGSLAIPFASRPLDPAPVEHDAFGPRGAGESPAAPARTPETVASIEPDGIEDIARTRFERDDPSPQPADLEERLADVLERAALESGIEIP